MALSSESAPLLQAVPHSLLRLGEDRLVVCAHSLGTYRVLRSSVARGLELFRPFRTAVDHAGRYLEYVRQRGDGSRAVTMEQVVSMIRDLQHAGLLITADALLAPPLERLESAPPISSVAIPTRDRPRHLARALDDIGANLRRFGRSPRIVIADDSRDEKGMAATREVIVRFSKRFGFDTRQIAVREKMLLSDVLSRRTGVPRRVVDFALQGIRNGDLPTTGGNRNALLLTTVGEVVFCLDDDTRPRAYAPPIVRSDLVLASSADPRVFSFFGDRRSAIRSLVRTSPDVLAEHEAVLGCSLATLLATRPCDVREASPALVDTARSGNATVLATVSGLAGYSGIGWPGNILLLRGVSRENLTASPEQFSAALLSGEVTKLTPATTLTDGAFLDLIFTGLDNRRAPVPFMPVLRSQDVLFAFMQRILRPGALFAFVPQTFCHGAPTRKEGIGATEYPGEPLCSIIGDILGEGLGRPPAADPDLGMRRLARVLKEFAAQPRRVVEDALHYYALRRACSRVNALEATLAAFGEAPEFWAAAVRGQIRAVVDGMGIDTRGIRLADVDRAGACDLLARFAEVLEAWPELVRAAVEARNGMLYDVGRVRA